MRLLNPSFSLDKATGTAKAETPTQFRLKQREKTMACLDVVEQLRYL